MSNEQVKQNDAVECAAQATQDASDVGELNVPTIESLQDQLAQMKEQWLRAVAENENLRKRAAKEQADARRYAASEFARDMVGVCENLYRALDNMNPNMLEGEENKILKTLHDGVEMTRSELIRAFEKQGITRIYPLKGTPFDHNVHQAVSQVEDNSVDNGSVLQVVQAGYQMHDRLLQPSMVVVAKSTTE